jgi:hypothetical protein
MPAKTAAQEPPHKHDDRNLTSITSMLRSLEGLNTTPVALRAIPATFWN